MRGEARSKLRVEKGGSVYEVQKEEDTQRGETYEKTEGGAKKVAQT